MAYRPLYSEQTHEVKASLEEDGPRRVFIEEPGSTRQSRLRVPHRLSAATLLSAVLATLVVIVLTRQSAESSRSVAQSRSETDAGVKAFLVGQAKSEASGVRPWDEAMGLAAAINEKLSETERAAILTGRGFDTVGHFVGVTAGVPRLGIPELKMQDGSAGVRPMAPNEFGTVTSWPSMLALAATWDPSTVEHVAEAIAEEFVGKGANVLLGPGLNVHRSPYGGRNWEYLSGEDPKLGAVLARAYVTAVQRKGVMVVAKHFAFNEQETQRKTSSSIVDTRTAQELYFPPFMAAIEAGAGAIMCSYNRVGEEFACESSKLLTDELRGRMGFLGFVMSDWEAIHDSSALLSGLDLEMPAPRFLNGDALANMQSAASVASERILAAMYHVRLEENLGCAAPCAAERSSNQRTPEHIRLADEAAARSVVLLKNDGVLPIDTRTVRKLAILGAATTTDTMNVWGAGSPYSGGGSGHVASPNVMTPLKAIELRATDFGIEVVAPQDAASADIVIVVGTATATESEDRASLSLENNVDDIISQWAVQKKVVVLLEVPGAVWTPWRDQTSAIACLFTGGEQTGVAWASILFGDMPPEGRLPITFPASQNGVLHPGLDIINYDEELQTGYRSSAVEAAFPFGHGLTYTSFEYSDPVVAMEQCSGVWCLSVTVKNVGETSGREVVQAYLRFDEVDGADGPFYLRAFQKTESISPEKTKVVILSFSDRDLSTFDVSSNSWLPASRVSWRIGSSSGNIRYARSVDL